MEKDVATDTSKPVITYELTRMDNVLFDYQDSGYLEFMAYQDEQHETDGYYVVDGQGYWLCEAPKSENKTDILSCTIECDESCIYCNLEPALFYAKFYDSGGEVKNISPCWEIDCDFKDKLNIEYIENAISIFVTDKKCINKSFKLSLSANGYT